MTHQSGSPSRYGSRHYPNVYRTPQRSPRKNEEDLWNPQTPKVQTDPPGILPHGPTTITCGPIHLTVGPMDLVHPVYVSTLNTYPLLIGKDLLNRFEPLIDFKHLKMRTQVHEPLPLLVIRLQQVAVSSHRLRP